MAPAPPGGAPPGDGMTTARTSWLAPLALALALAGPARAAELATELAGRSLSCGVGQAFYMAPDLSAVTVLASAEGPFPVDERQVPLALERRSATALAFAATMADGRHVYRLERSKGAIVLRVDGDEAGDDCHVEQGRAAFVVTRFDMIREGLCGNDPRASCIAALRRACGSEPTPACYAKVKASRPPGAAG